MSNSNKTDGPNQIRDDHFAEPWLGATLVEAFTYLTEHSKAGVEYVGGGKDDWDRAALGNQFTWNVLRNAARAGALSWRGSQLRGDHTAKDIPLEVLRSERLSFDPTSDEGRGRLSLNGTIWRDLRFDVEQIKTIWPAPKPVDQDASAAPAAPSPSQPNHDEWVQVAGERFEELTDTKDGKVSWKRLKKEGGWSDAMMAKHVKRKSEYQGDAGTIRIILNKRRDEWRPNT